MKNKIFEGFSIIGVIAIIGFIIGCIVGYINNIIWLFGYTGDVSIEVIISIIGIVAAPLGVIHGVYLWF